MIFRLVLIVLGLMTLYNVGYSQIPTLDVPGTLQAGNEVGQTINSVRSSVESMNFLQKTSAAIGTYKENVSEFITNQKEKIEKIQEKAKKYKEKAEEYKAQIEAYKAQIEKVEDRAKDGISRAKDAVNQAEDYYNQAQESISSSTLVDKGLEKRIDKDIEENTAEKDNKEDITNAKIVDKDVLASTRQGFKSDEVIENEIIGKNNSRGIINSINKSNTTAKNIKNLSSNISVTGEKGKLSASSINEGVKVKGGLNQVQGLESSNAVVFTKDARNDEIVVERVNNQIRSNIEELKSAPADTSESDMVLSPKKVNLDKKNSEILKDKKQNQVEQLIDDKNPNNKHLLMNAKETKDGISSGDQENNIDKPVRTIFKVSSGHSSIRSSSTLAFATTISIDKKTGETSEGVIIVPNSVSIICDLDYEKAAKGTNYADCLKSINDTVYSQDDNITAEDRENALKDMSNSYIELLATQYFEGLQIYNESFYFKNNEIDPVLNSEVTNIRDAWQYAKEMNQKVGSRINIFNKLNSRALGLKGFSLYHQLGIKTNDKTKADSE